MKNIIDVMVDMIKHKTSLYFHIFLIVLCLVGIYGILPQLHTFHSPLALLYHAQRIDILLAIVCTFATFPVAALTYIILSRRRLPYLKLTFVQLASVFANRLLPAGIGGLGVNYLYLRKQKNSQNTSLVLLVLNNLLGMVGHCLILIAILLARPSLPSAVHLSLPVHGVTELMLALIIVTVIALYARKIRKTFIAGVQRVIVRIKDYRDHRLRLAGALISSISLTVCNILTLYYSERALHFTLPLNVLIVALTFGIVLGASSFSPGGIGTTEIGLIASLIALHVSATNALALALLFRLVSFWLTLIVGGIAFVVTRWLHYF